MYLLRDARFDNISLDLLYGIPGQSAADLERDLADALALEPEHLSCYELEAKPGTRFTHAHGDELERQAEAMEGYFETVVETLTGAGYRWYETANFCLDSEHAAGETSEPSTTSRTGEGATTWASGSARCRRCRESARRNLPGARGATSPRSRRASDRRREVELLDERHASARAADARAAARRARCASPTSTASVDARSPAAASRSGLVELSLERCAATSSASRTAGVSSAAA